MTPSAPSCDGVRAASGETAWCAKRPTPSRWFSTSREPCAHRFRYRPGQFLTLRVEVAGREHRRCYSMSSSPVLGEDLRITVKRDRDGWCRTGSTTPPPPAIEIHAAPPEGRFVLGDTDRELVAFAGGSGITPVFSLIRSALAGTARPVRLFYANRSRDSVIFADALAMLADAACRPIRRCSTISTSDSGRRVSRTTIDVVPRRRGRRRRSTSAGRHRSWIPWNRPCWPPASPATACTSSASTVAPSRRAGRDGDAVTEEVTIVLDRQHRHGALPSR